MRFYICQFIIIVCSFITIPVSFANPSEPTTSNDSVSVTQLQELVVKSESRWFEGNTLVCIPSKKEKNLSDSPASLIREMHIPLLRVKDGEVTDLRGNGVVYYINGVKAEPTEASTSIAPRKQVPASSAYVYNKIELLSYKYKHTIKIIR